MTGRLAFLGPTGTFSEAALLAMPASSATLDELGFGEPLVITDEIALPVRFALMVRPGTSMADVLSVATHPHAEAQCRGWLAAHLPRAHAIPASSTAAAAARWGARSQEPMQARCPRRSSRAR